MGIRAYAFTDIYIKGIEHVTKQQIRNAKEQNKFIKLIASKRTKAIQVGSKLTLKE